MKIISQAALVLIVVFSLLLVVSNGGIKDTCKMYAADGADMGITYDGCVSSLAKMAYREPQITAMVVMIGPLFHTWFLAVGLGALYSLISLEAGTKDVSAATSLAQFCATLRNSLTFASPPLRSPSPTSRTPRS